MWLKQRFTFSLLKEVKPDWTKPATVTNYSVQKRKLKFRAKVQFQFKIETQLDVRHH